MNEASSIRGKLFDSILLLLLLTILAVRSMYGLDLSDEMQYYGQIAALIASRSLFETDLFIQQLVYVPFYPLFKLHEAFFQQAGLVLFGRLILAGCLIFLFFYTRSFLRQLESGIFHSGIAAFALTFAITYHGIFAVSYNSISQIAWVLFFLWFIEWSGRHWWRWAVLVVFMAFAHLAAALVIVVLLCTRLIIEQRRTEVFSLLARVGILFSLTLVVLSYFTTWQDFWDSLTFSKGFSVGTQLLSSPKQWLAAAIFISSLTLLNVLPVKWITFVPWTPVLFVMLLIEIGRLLMGNPVSGYSSGAFLMTSIMVLLALGRLRVGTPPLGTSAVIRLHWLSFGIAAHFLTLVTTSSNGLGQGTGAMLVALPLLLADSKPFASKSFEYADKGRLLATITVGLMVVLFVAHWSMTPYRDTRWYKPKSRVFGIPEFTYISTSHDHADWLRAFQEQFVGSLHGKNVLVVSEKPALYFALNAVPQTCMLYMHSIGSSKASEVLTRCLDRRNPYAILYVYPEGAQSERTWAVKGFATDYARHREMTCHEDLSFPIQVNSLESKSVNYILCQRVVTSPI